MNRRSRLRTRHRNVLFGMQRILRDVIRSIVADQSDMEIVGEPPNGVEASEIEALGPSFFTVGLDGSGELPRSTAQLLANRSSVRVLGPSSEGRRGFLYELGPYKVPIGEVSPEVLVSTIRATGSQQ